MATTSIKKVSPRAAKRAIPAKTKANPPVLTIENDPRVIAAAKALVTDIVERSKSKRVGEDARRATIEKRRQQQVKKRKSMEGLRERLHKMSEPLRAIHDLAEHAIGADYNHEASLIAAINLSMLCLKRLDDCLIDMGDAKMGDADEWLDIAV